MFDSVILITRIIMFIVTNRYSRKQSVASTWWHREIEKVISYFALYLYTCSSQFYNYEKYNNENHCRYTVLPNFHDFSYLFGSLIVQLLINVENYKYGYLMSVPFDLWLWQVQCGKIASISHWQDSRMRMRKWCYRSRDQLQPTRPINAI